MVREIGLGIIINNNEILLVKRKFPPHEGKWAPPGGFLDDGESIGECVKREVKEETGLDVKIKGLISSVTVQDHEKDRVNRINFSLCSQPKGKKRDKSEECVSIRWFDLDKVSSADLMPVVRKVLEEQVLKKRGSSCCK